MQNYDLDPDEMRQRFREIFDELRHKKPTKPRTLNLRAAPSQKPASATPDKKSLQLNKESVK
jgi:hypothetical protein